MNTIVNVNILASKYNINVNVNVDVSVNEIDGMGEWRVWKSDDTIIRE